MAGIVSINNGKRGGRPKGRKNNATIERQAAVEAYKQRITESLSPLFHAQLSLALGVTYLFRIQETEKGGRKHEIVTDPDEIGDILAQMAQQQNYSGVYNDQYFYISTKAPDGKSIDSMVQQVAGRPQQSVDLTSGGKPLLVANDEGDE